MPPHHFHVMNESINRTVANLQKIMVWSICHIRQISQVSKISHVSQNAFQKWKWQTHTIDRVILILPGLVNKSYALRTWVLWFLLTKVPNKYLLINYYIVSGAENVADATLDFTSLSPPGGLRILVIHDLVNTHYSWVSCAFGSAELRPYSSGNQLKRRTKKCNIFQGWLCLSEFLLCSRSPLCFLCSQST